jgi:hypothetical protein
MTNTALSDSNKILSAEELKELYPDSQYPAYTIKQWRKAVNGFQTIDGYWEWVHQKLVNEAQLEEDND